MKLKNLLINAKRSIKKHSVKKGVEINEIIDDVGANANEKKIIKKEEKIISN